MQHNQLESQHSFTSEYQQEILESAANFSYVYEIFRNFSRFYTYKNRDENKEEKSESFVLLSYMCYQ